MRPLTTARRTTPKLALALLVTAALLSIGPAHAQSGNGLYEPFPEAAVKKRAQRYVEGLSSRMAEAGRRYSDAELDRGAFVDADGAGRRLESGVATARGAASERAGGGAGPGADLALPLQLALLAAALGGTMAITLRWAGQRDA